MNTFNQLIQMGNQLYSYPVGLGNNFALSEYQFNQAYMNYARQVSNYLAQITPTGQLPFGFDPGQPDLMGTFQDRQEMFDRTNEYWLQGFTGSSASTAASTDTFTEDSLVAGLESADSFTNSLSVDSSGLDSF